MQETILNFIIRDETSSDSEEWDRRAVIFTHNAQCKTKRTCVSKTRPVQLLANNFMAARLSSKEGMPRIKLCAKLREP